MFLWPLCWWQGKAEPGVLTEAASDTSSSGLCGALHGATVSSTILSRTGSRGGQYRLCSGSEGAIASHVWRRRPTALLAWSSASDGTLQVREAEDTTSDAAVLSRSSTIRMCSFKHDDQLKAVNRL